MKKYILISFIILSAINIYAKELSNQQKVVELLQKAFNTKPDRSVLKYINTKKYIQHNLYAQDGIEGLKGYLDYLKGQKIQNKVIRAFEDKNYVVAHSFVTQEDKNYKVIDIFRFENNLIVEHWDNTELVENIEELKGEVKVIDKQKTLKNKQLVQAFIKTKVLSADYLKNHMILGQGNFILAVNETYINNKRFSIYELFNIKNSKIYNSWSVKEEILPLSQWQNENGKF